MSQEAINVCLTGAAGQIAYALIPHLINGSVFKKPVNLFLLDIEPMEEVLKGVVMEIEDYASPHLSQVVATCNPLKAFKNCDVAILVGAMPRKQGMQRSDLLKANAAIFKIQGQALDRVAHKTCKVIVVGNPANTNAFIVSHYAKSIPKENFTALTRLDHNRAQGQLAKRLGVRVEDVEGTIIWGNHSITQYPDVSNVTIKDMPLKMEELGEEWIRSEFIPTVQNRGAAVIQARKLSSALSAAKAIIDQLKDWIYGTPPGKFVSMAVISDGSYSSPAGTYFSFPCTSKEGGAWEIVKGFSFDEDGKAMIAKTSAELIAEKEEADLCLINSPDLTAAASADEL